MHLLLLIFFSFPPKLPMLQLLALLVTLPKHFQREATKLHQRRMFTSFIILLLRMQQQPRASSRSLYRLSSHCPICCFTW